MGLLQDFLEGKRILVGDGGMGTMLFSQGRSPGDCLELLNADEPGAPLSVHEAYLDAGADVLTTNTFGGNARRLAPHGLSGRMHELNLTGARLARLARQAAGAAGREVLVAGSVGAAYSPADSGDFPFEDARDIFSAQCRALADRRHCDADIGKHESGRCNCHHDFWLQWLSFGSSAGRCSDAGRTECKL